MRIAWLTRNVRKSGASAITDSFTPRRFNSMRKAMAANSTTSLSGTPSATPPLHAGGSKLKMASPAAAMEMEIVST